MSLQNFDTSREAMVVSQLQPSGIVDEKIMDVYRRIPREMFVPNAMRGVCYMDDDVSIGHGRFLMEPLIHARMVQDAGLMSSDKVLDVGCSTGYSAAVLASLAGKVIALDEDEFLLQSAPQKWQQLGLHNITAVVGEHRFGALQEGPTYNAIFLNGAVPAIPERLVEQLATGGRLYCVVQPEENVAGQLVVLVRENGELLLHKNLGAATTLPLKGFVAPAAFEF